MCGLAGIARLDGGVLGAEADALLDAMARVVAHRGPDDRELLRDGPVGLAFTRLSLVDPDGGAQPLVSEDGSLVLIANGEIYNHRELAAGLTAGWRPRTGSDCEVLLNLYRERGLKFLDSVRGMFAVIIWDRTNGQLIFARDRFGIKPLYFHRTRERVVFGSEIKVLFTDPDTPRRLDWQRALVHPMLSAAPQLVETDPTTWFEDVASVPAATVMRIDLRDGTTSEHRYWTLPDSEQVPGSDAELTAEYGRLLAESVADCATADTELGLFLSGGVDSAAVAALAVEHARPLHTFTVLSAATHANGDAVNARRVADFLGVPNHQVIFDASRVPTAQDWKRLLWLTETPQCGPEQYYKYELHRYAKASRPEIRGMLLGAASDEFNGGYSTDFAAGGGWPGFVSNLRVMTRNGALRKTAALAPWFDQLYPAVLTDDAVASFGHASAPRDPYRDYLRWEYTKIQQYNCWNEDRTAAGSGVEARVPFLDHRIVELVASIPPDRRQALFWDKRILRDAMGHLLPPDIAERQKVAFYHGQAEGQTFRVFAEMLLKDNEALLEDAFADAQARSILNRTGIRDILHRELAGPSTSNVELILRLVNLALLSRMAADLPRPTAVTPAAAVLTAVSPTDPAELVEKVAQRLAFQPDLAVDRVPRWNDGVLLLRSPSDEWYIAVDGSIEFVLDDDEPDWLRFLLAIDGSRSLGTIVAELRVDPDALAPLIVEALSSRLLEIAPVAEALPAPQSHIDDLATASAGRGT
jgi:asparagine synthase (glutamine-hydrolysing)